MSRDTIDDLLDASAPATPRIDPVDIRRIAIAARAETAPPRRVRRTAALSGALALLLVAGAGVATATSDWLWGAGLENPERSYSYTAPTWGECEIRVSGIETHNVLTQASVNRIVDEWFATTNVEAAAAPFVDEHLAVLETAQAEDSALQADPRVADLNAWTAHEQALSDALFAELRAHGLDTSALAGAESHSQLHCEGEDWGGEGGTP